MIARASAAAALLMSALAPVASAQTAPSQTAPTQTVPPQAVPAWTDPAPHTVRFVDVAPNVTLEVLDWGGTGRDVVLLTGSGHTAHVYDEFALKLKALGAYHVYGITRRGYGASSVPENGYDESSLSNDVWTVVQSLDLKAPVLVGHSLGGIELTGVARLHSARLGGVVFLDSLGDPTDDPDADPARMALKTKLPPAKPRTCVEDRSTFAAFRTFLQCQPGITLPESELRAGFETTADGGVGRFTSPSWVSRAIGTGRPARDFSNITVPVLALNDAVDFDLSHLRPDQPQPRDEAERALVIAFGKATQVVLDRWTANLKRAVPGAKVIDMPGATHYIWMTREADVLREIHTFASALPPVAKALQPASAWTDPSPHTVRFVDVAPNVTLEVLDWGGTGRDVVLLTGSGHTAHVYDEFAIKLKLKGAYHVYGITRRGYGASSVPESGYDEPSLSNDVWMVIKTLGLKKPVLIGHSMAGAELTGVGMVHSDAIGGLVYLDALGDATDDPPADPGFKALQPKLPPPGPAPDCRRDRSSFAAFRASLACSNGLFLPEAELRAGFAAAADGSVGSAKSPGWVSRAIGTGRPPRDYSKITVPVLALQDAIDFDLTQLKPDQPQPRTDEERAILIRFGKAVQAVFDRWSANLKKGVPGAKVVDMPGAGHYLWMTQEGVVLREIHAFIAAIPAAK